MPMPNELELYSYCVITLLYVLGLMWATNVYWFLDVDTFNYCIDRKMIIYEYAQSANNNRTYLIRETLKRPTCFFDLHQFICINLNLIWSPSVMSSLTKDFKKHRESDGIKWKKIIFPLDWYCFANYRTYRKFYKIE